MAKGDYVEVVAGNPESQTLFRVDASGAGQKVEAEWDAKKPLLHVRLLTRNGNPIVTHDFATSIVLRVSSKVKAE